MFSWPLRVAGAIVLAALLRNSDGSAFWAGVLPALLTCGAVLVIVWQFVVVPRRTRA
jgi:hypothetical protein